METNLNPRWFSSHLSGKVSPPRTTQLLQTGSSSLTEYYHLYIMHFTLLVSVLPSKIVGNFSIVTESHLLNTHFRKRRKKTQDPSKSVTLTWFLQHEAALAKNKSSLGCFFSTWKTLLLLCVIHFCCSPWEWIMCWKARSLSCVEAEIMSVKVLFHPCMTVLWKHRWFEPFHL